MPKARPAEPRHDMTWHDQAACNGEPVTTFFGVEHERGDEKRARERRAKAICRRCPVRTQCLEYALERPEKSGTWGGLNEDERVSERRRRMRRERAA